MLRAAEADLGAVAAMGWYEAIGIPLAVLGAVMLSFGAQYQSRGLNKVERIVGQSAGSGLSLSHILSLLKRPSWVSGTLLLGLAVVCQLASMLFAPLIVVQPIGVVALVMTSVLNARVSGVRLGKRARSSIAMCVLGIVAFVTIASFNATNRPVTARTLTVILITYAVVLAVVVGAFLLLRHRRIALMYIVGAGVLYGFVATFAKSVIVRLQQGDLFHWLTLLCLAAMLIGTLLGMVFVQNAYSSGPPDLVVAGLTVIDPMVAVLIGVVVLHEAANAHPVAAVFWVLAAAVSAIGVLGLAKYHPQAQGDRADQQAAS